MALRTGLRSTKEYHDTNTGMGYTPFKLKSDGDSALIRVLAHAEPYYDGQGNPQELEGERYIRSIVMHRDFKKMRPTRCLAEGDEPDTEACPLCRVKAPRSLRTFIPLVVKRRRDAKGEETTSAKEREQVQWIEYGRDGLQEVISVVEEIEDNEITAIDFKVKRVGKELDTKYKWYPVAKTAGPLSDEEKALEFEDPQDFIPLKDYDEVDKIALDFQRAAGAKKVDDTPDEDEDEIPF